MKFINAKKGHYFSLLAKMVYDGVSRVQEHVLKLVHYYNKLKSMKVNLCDRFLIWQALESLPTQFYVLKASYHTKKGELIINELISIVKQIKT